MKLFQMVLSIYLAFVTLFQLNKRLFQHIKNTQNKEFFITISFVEVRNIATVQSMFKSLNNCLYKQGEANNSIYQF